MFNRIVTIFLFSLFIVSSVFSQETVVKKKSLLIDDESVTSSQTRVVGTESPLTAANYVAVDTMQNSFSPGSNAVHPLAYDPLTNVIAVVHRGSTTYAAGSGEIWWNYSTDMGDSWVRSSTSVQNGATSQILGRYPSMALFNPTQSTAIADLWGVFSWPELQSSFAYLGYGVSLGMDESAFAEIDFGPPLYGSNVPTFSDDSYVYWASDNQDDASLRLFRTTDYSVIEKIDPPQWADTVFNSSGNIAIGGVGTSDAVYFGVLGTFPELIGEGGWEPGYSKSTDHGATWSEFSVVNWLEIPLTADFDEIWDWKKGDEFVSYSGTINVDTLGLVHIVTGMTDTLTGRNALVEFYETSESVWDAKIIADSIKDNTWFSPPDDAGGNPTDPALGQMGYDPFLATAKGLLVCQWVQGSPAAGDTLCDIYVKYRTLNGEWSSEAVNLTETDGMNEDGAHLAPQLGVVEDAGVRTYYAFSMYWYEAGNTDALINSVGPAVVYIASVPVYSEDVVGVDDNSPLVNDYKLNQNYPNPFNPTTTISFTLPERSFVSLKVYDVLGKEVATIINGVKESGANVVNFNASNLASGVYIYKLTAGNFTDSKKMLIMK